LSGWLLAPSRRRWTLAAVIVLALGYAWRWQAGREEIRLTVLPLAGSHAVWLKAGGSGGDWLIGCGNTNAVQFVTKPFLRSQGVNRLSNLMLTHGDLKHVGGADALEAAFHPAELWTSGIRFRSPTYRRIVDTWAAQPDRHRLVHHGDQAGPWRVLHPEPGDRYSQGDDNALVLQGEFQRVRVLLLSDLGREGQEALLRREPELRADIVVAGLPEQGEPLKDGLLDQIRPKLLIVADSEFPATRRASPALCERLAKQSFPVLYTRQSGAVTLTFSRSGWQATTRNGVRVAGSREGIATGRSGSEQPKGAP
jgi:beta-lactamase superfamily II metal-dependent hydrolase